MGILSVGKLRSRRYVRVELKKSVMGWDFNKVNYRRANGCFHTKTIFHSQPHKHQAICGMWAYLPVSCVQAKHRGEGKTFGEVKCI